MKKAFLILTLGTLVLSSCEDIDTNTLEDNQGAFILNKGNTETSSLSRYNYEQESVTNNIFQIKNNGLQLGPGASAFAVKRSENYLKGRGYMVFTDRGEVDMINMETYRVEATVAGLSYPNDIVLANENTAYVSCGNGVSATDKDNVVAKIDLEKNTVVKTIPAGVAPGKLTTSGKYLYVANSGGQNKDGSSVTIIDMSNDVVIETVTVGIQPTDMEVDTDRNIWVYCDGDASGNQQSLYRIDRVFEGESISHDPTLILDLGTKVKNEPNALAMTRDGLFVIYMHGKAFIRSIYKEGTDVEDSEAISGENKDLAFVGIDVDSKTGQLHGLTQGTNGQGTFVVFKRNSDGYEYANSYEVGINPILTTYFY